MKKSLRILFVFMVLPSITLTMDDPNKWQPTRPSGSGRPSHPRPQVINFGIPNPNPTNPPAIDTLDELIIQPVQPSLPGSSRPSRPRPQVINFGTAPNLNIQNQPVVPAATPIAPPTPGTAPMNPMHIINTQTPTQPTVTNPMHIITTTTPAPTAAAPQSQAMSAKEKERIGKIDKDLDKIEKSLKEMGWSFGEGALSAAGFDPIGTVGGVAMGLYHLGKINVLLVRVMHTSQKLSKGSPAAIAARDARLPRISKLNNAIEKLKSIFSSEKEAKEAK